MKSMKTKVNSLTAKGLATSMLLVSCTPNADFDQKVVEQSDINSDKDITDSKGVSISLSLNEETKQALRDIAPLVQEIIDNPKVAQELSKDPESFCKQRGYNFTIDLDDAIFKVIVALGNEEINEALKNNDFEKFMQLCADMKLLEAGQKVKLNALFQNEDEQEIFNAIAYELNGETIETRSVAFWLAVSVVLVIAIILTYTVGMDESLSIDDEKVPIQQLKPDLQSEDNVLPKDKINIITSQKMQSFLHYADPNYSVLDVWALKNINVSDYQLVSYLKVNKPDVFTKYSEMQISEFLKKNIIV